MMKTSLSFYQLPKQMLRKHSFLEPFGLFFMLSPVFSLLQEMVGCFRGGNRMKKIISLILLGLVPLTLYAQDTLNFPIEPNMAKEWKYQSDQVMGGVSEGNVSLMQDAGMFFFRLTGDVSTDNNGGFVQYRSKVSIFNKPEMFQLIHKAHKDGVELEGVRLNVKGNGETYHVMIRTYFTWSPSDYYYHTFDTSPNWQDVDLPFDQFKSSKYRQRDLEVDQIRDFAVVAYGRDFKSDVSVSEISFY